MFPELETLRCDLRIPQPQAGRLVAFATDWSGQTFAKSRGGHDCRCAPRAADHALTPHGRWVNFFLFPRQNNGRHTSQLSMTCHLCRNAPRVFHADVASVTRC